MNILFLPTTVLLLALIPFLGRADGIKPPSSGELYDYDKPGALSELKTDDAVTGKITDLKGAKRVQVDFSKLEGYPGINFPVPAGGWDLGGSSGIQIEVANSGPDAVTVNLKIENEGDWHNSPWNTDMVTVGPGETQTLKVIFGRSFNQPGFKLDTAHVTGVRLYIVPGKNPASVTLGKPKVFKDDTVTQNTAGPAPQPEEEEILPPPPEPVKPVPVFPPTPILDITGKHDFPAGSTINDDAAVQLKGLCSLAEFRALPEMDRHVYSFEVWPGDQDQLGVKSYPFNFLLGTEGVTGQKVAFSAGGEKDNFSRLKDSSVARNVLGGFGNLDWGANSIQSYKFNKPVTAFGVVLRSSADMAMQRFFWNGANELNGFPVSYTLADGSIIQLGKRDLAAGKLKGDADDFIGVIDRTGLGIVSATFSFKGLAGDKGQSLNMVHMAFATMPKPALASVINLKSSCDFDAPENIQPSPLPLLKGLAQLGDFRFIVANKRYVYHFDTWPQESKESGSDSLTFPFDLKGKGEAGQKVSIMAKNSANNAKLVQTVLKNEDGISYPVLGGLGDIGKNGWAEQTFKFEKPVWGFGVTYRSAGEAKLAAITADGKNHAVSYTLTDGSVVNLGGPGEAPNVLSKDGKTFVGVVDRTDKGIVLATIHVQGGAAAGQPLYIEDLAFAFSGPPPGNWKLTMEDNFDGDKLNPKYWAPGYTFKDVINNEMQGFTPDQITVANGICSIKVEQKDCLNTDRQGRTGGAQKFASGAFTSYDKFTQTYGYFEARIKMPHARGAGIWPAFWMLPDRGKEFPDERRGDYRSKDNAWGMGSEIDIFEFMPRWKRLDGLFRIHMGTIWSYGPETPEDPAPHGYGTYALDNNGWGPEELAFPNLDSEFHTYGIYWSPERLIFYIDSKPVFRVKDPKNIPDVPEYFLFNISISGNGWGADPLKKNPTIGQIIKDMPNSMEIDYFRAYSGTLEEAIPAAETDNPAVIRKYSPPAALPPPAQPAPSANPAPATPQGGAPAAPVNSGIVSPSSG